ncbi:MAG: HD domain-containing protein [Syntrophaceae bacterium]|nr:HD domain-containing protein [Syntrophaceae bacterium]
MKNPIHRGLAVRLATVALCTALTLMFLVFWVELKNLDSRVQDQSTAAVERLRWSIINELDAGDLGNHSRIQLTLEKYFAVKKRAGQLSFVYIQILDPSFRQIAQVQDPSNMDIKQAINQILQNPNKRYQPETALRQRIAKVNGTFFIQLGKPLENSQGKPAAYIEGIYTISPSYIRQARYNAVKIALLAAGIVLLTTLILYPTIIQLLKKVAGLSVNLVHANLEILSVLGSAIAKRDRETGIHNCRVSIYAIRIAQEIGLEDDEMRSLIKGAFLHDVGKIGVRDSILLKPGSLTPEEFEETKQHVRYGLDIVSRSVWLADAAPIIGGHHEKYDGSGYLEGLKGKDIPRVARIFAVADVFDALTSKRPYKETMGCMEAVESILRGRGSHFDPDILDVFVKIAPELYETYAELDDKNLISSLKQLGAGYFLHAEKGSL